jgi:hypothetical protein
MKEKTIRELEIDELYNMVLRKISGGSLWGDPINIYDIRELVVGAYLVGNLERSSFLFKSKELVNEK